MKSGHPEGAERLERMRAAVRASPRSTTFVALAHALCDEGGLEESEAICLQGLSHHPELPTGQVALARTWLEAGKTAQAEMRLLETIRQHPHHADAYRYLAKTMVLTGRRDEAVALLTRTRSQIVWTHDLAVLLESLTGGGTPASAGGERDPEITRVTNMRGLARRTRDRRQWQRRQADRREGGGERRREENRTPLPPPDQLALELGDQELEEFQHAEATPSAPIFVPESLRNATPVERTNTPTGSFPPISTEGPQVDPAGGTRLPTRWALFLGVPALLIVVLGALQGLRGGRLNIPWPASAHAPSTWAVAHDAPAAPPSQLRTDLQADLQAGTLTRLLHARDLAAGHLTGHGDDEDVRATLAFVVGLLAFDHGLVPDKDARGRLMLADAGSPGTPSGHAHLYAARALLALADGDLLAAAEATRLATAAGGADDALVALAAIATRYRGGDLIGATTLLDARPNLVGRLGAARPTVAALFLDRGKLDTAQAVLTSGGADAAGDALILLLGEEARRAERLQGRGRAGASTPVAGGAERLAAACAAGKGPAPALEASCLLNAGVELRLAGDRAGALAKALSAAAVSTNNPRTLGGLAQLLANLGEIDAAAVQAEHAARLASAAFPALAWANVAIAVGRGSSAPAPAGIPIAGSEARVVAARAAGGGGRASSPGDPDPDLRMLSSLQMQGSYHQVIHYVEGLARQPDHGPVAAYVGGVLALRQGRRHLAARLLAEALTGHGDSCRAAQEYKTVLGKLKQDDKLTADLAPLLKQNSRCRVE